eukprot:CAMPEP_0184656754 /NCGR_PEP_ID=MMETSP0308-20130426/16730_1 /TAXON_ID=38269 /ORGANISM="Gloeochaete witrockiana, Strain SAG 46.84" /LENGTH=73 /DNA_ID=CAMNT_0027094015 /DNA_START=428 /DNA_END=646 /DNA_ORIENTATION=-
MSNVLSLAHTKSSRTPYGQQQQWIHMSFQELDVMDSIGESHNHTTGHSDDEYEVLNGLGHNSANVERLTTHST